MPLRGKAFRLSEPTARLEAFSDGVFAIAITLLVLELRAPDREVASSNDALWAALGALWPSYLAFVLSFFVVLVMWVNHHHFMRMLRRVDNPFLFANGLLLLVVTFIPFPTAVLAEHLDTPSSRAAVVFYCATFVGASLTWTLLLDVTIRRGLLGPDVSADTVRRLRRANTVGPIVYAIATVIAFFNALAGLAVNVSLWVLWMTLRHHRSGTHASEAARTSTP